MRNFITHPVTIYVTAAVLLIFVAPVEVNIKAGLLVGFLLVVISTYIKRAFGGKP